MAKAGAKQKGSTKLKALTSTAARKLKEGARLVVVESNHAGSGPNGEVVTFVSYVGARPPVVTIRRDNGQQTTCFIRRFALAPTAPRKPKAPTPTPEYAPGARVVATGRAGENHIGVSRGTEGTVVKLKRGMRHGGTAYKGDTFVVFPGRPFAWRCRAGVDVVPAPVAKVVAPAVWRRGDVVRGLETYGSQFTRGKEYVLRENATRDWCRFVEDDMGSRTNGWERARFEWVRRPEPPKAPTPLEKLEDRVAALEESVARVRKVVAAL